MKKFKWIKKNISLKQQNREPFVCNSSEDHPKTDEQKARGPPALPPVDHQLCP